MCDAPWRGDVGAAKPGPTHAVYLPFVRGFGVENRYLLFCTVDFSEFVFPDGEVMPSILCRHKSSDSFLRRYSVWRSIRSRAIPYFQTANAKAGAVCYPNCIQNASSWSCRIL